MKKFTVTAKSSLKDFTDCTYPQGSFYFGALLKRGDIRVNGVKVRENRPLKEGDEVVYYTTLKEEAKPSHSVVYEDSNLLVLDKQSGVSSEALFAQTGLFPVHRLDRNTEGLIVLAKTEAVQNALIEAFRSRTVEKVYLCIAKNAFKAKSATLTAYLKKDENRGLVRIYPAPNGGATEIITEYSVVEEFGDCALVRVVLHTGKTHQIRAHLAHIGCPVLGDTKYGDFALNKKYGAARQLLVAKYLKFNLSGEISYLNAIRFESARFPALPKKQI